MNRIEKAILNQAKKILIKHFMAELEDCKKRLSDSKDVFYLDILNTGIILDIQAAKQKGIEALEKQIRKTLKYHNKANKKQN